MKFDSSTLINASVLDPLRGFDVLSGVGAFDAHPERLVELAVERIAQQAKEVERLREVNAKVLASVESAPGSGLRKRLKAAQEALADAERRSDINVSYLHKGYELMDGYRADIKTLATAIAAVVDTSPDLPADALAKSLTAKWKRLALDEVAQRADTLIAAVSAAVAAYRKSARQPP